MDNIRSNQSIYITQPSEQTDNLKRILKENNASALAVIPLKIPGTVLGALIFMSDVSIDWSSKHYVYLSLYQI
jgi:hypothetical protein